MSNNPIRLLVLPALLLGRFRVRHGFGRRGLKRAMNMKKTLNFLATLVIGGAILAVPAAASSLLELTGTGSNTYNGLAAFPYEITVNGGSALPMMCDDAQTGIYTGYSWNANAYSLTSTNLPNLKFASLGSASTVLNDYEVAAYIESGVATGTMNAGDGNAAVWSIFDPSFNTSFDHSNITTILNNAQTAVNAGNLNFSGITIYTPTPLRASQEFIYGTVTTNPHPSSAPEPATYAMLGGGLLALGFFGRRLRNRR
ncbi:MAG: PEP-CTERM sorting domain-containing protein [Bryobacteraceae bacterium]|jgi:hypothetical protein